MKSARAIYCVARAEARLEVARLMRLFLELAHHQHLRSAFFVFVNLFITSTAPVDAV